MAIAALLRRVDRIIGRLNRWLTPAALADGTLQAGTPQQADPRHVTAALGEIQNPPDRDEPREASE